jgi:hypothetical protein
VQKEEGDTEMLRVAMGKISSSSFHTLPTFDVQHKINEISAVIPLLGSLLLGLGGPPHICSSSFTFMGGIEKSN